MAGGCTNMDATKVYQFSKYDQTTILKHLFSAISCSFFVKDDLIETIKD